jgi:DNA end-binding protein Ku
MQSVKSASLHFGMASIPCKMFKAIESHDLSGHLHHGPDCLGSIGFKKVCKECGEEVAHSDIVKGYTSSDGNTVIVTQEEINTLDTEQDTGLEVVDFVPADKVDPIYYETTYYLAADVKSKQGGKAAEKNYAVLLHVLRKSERVAIVRFTLRQKTYAGVLRAYGDVLVVHRMVWADEIRSTGELVRAQIDLPDMEVEMAEKLVALMSSDDWDPTILTDRYTERLGELIESKSVGDEFVVTSNDDDDAAGDLLAKLTASIAALEKKAA